MHIYVYTVKTSYVFRNIYDEQLMDQLHHILVLKSTFVERLISEAKIEPPIHTEYLRSGGAMILIFIVDGAKAVISFCIRSAIPGYIEVPNYHE